MSLDIKQQIEIDGIGMGVLSDGTPFLTERGRARLCGVVQHAVQNFTQEWLQEADTPRVTKIRFKKYLNAKVKDKELPASFAQLAIAAYSA